MGRHVIIGKGNLGLDLKIALEKYGHEVRVYTRSEGFSWAQCKTEILSMQPEGLWITAGFGSVEQCKADPQGAIQTHVVLPFEIAQSLPEGVRLGLFSSDYVADESDTKAPAKHNPRPKSFYACTKLWMEQAVSLLNRPQTSVFRVGSLYGNHYPLKTFPGKLRSRFTSPCEVELPQNWVCPTPTWWVAETIAQSLARAFNDKGPITHHVSPRDGCTVIQWGRKVLGDAYSFRSKGFDPNRPAFSSLGCSLMKPEPTWEELWDINLGKLSRS